MEQENGLQNYQSGNNVKLFNIRSGEVYKWRKDDEEAVKEEIPIVLRSMTQKAGQWAAFDIPYPIFQRSHPTSGWHSRPPVFFENAGDGVAKVNAFYFDQDNKTLLLKLFTGSNGEQSVTINPYVQEIEDPDGSTNTDGLLT